MEVYLLKEGERFGPYSPEQVEGCLSTGEFSESDLAFFDGCDGWVPVTQVPGIGPHDDEDFNDPEVDYDRQRELSEIFHDPDDDSFDDEEEEEVAPLPETTQVPDDPMVVHADTPPPDAEPVQDYSSTEASPSSESAEQSVSAGRGGKGRRFSLSKAQAAMQSHGGGRRGKRQGGIPFPARPGAVAFGWLIFLTLLYGIGASVMPEAGVRRASPEFAQVFGQLHPILVHLPIGALLLVFPMHLCDRPGLFRHVGIGSTFVLWFAVVGSVLAVFTGYFVSFGGVIDTDSLNLHVTTGVLVGSGICAALFLKLLSLRFGEAWLHHLCSAFLLATVITLFYNLHTGASLTHGKDYLEPQTIEEPVDKPEQLEGNETSEASDDSKNPEPIEESPFRD